MSAILVTGGSGFIGSCCILQPLAAGHQVRTTVRSSKREADLRSMLKEGGAEPGDRLSFVVADLENDAGWAEAVAGCEYVLHVASPLPPGVPKHEDELRLYFGVVDVRDVANLHIRAMSNPAAVRERFLAVAGDFVSMLDIAKILKRRMAAAAKRVPTRQLPDWLVRIAAMRESGDKVDPC